MADKNIATEKISNRTMRYVMKYRSATDINRKVDINTALTLLSIAQNMPTTDANKIIQIAETLVK